MYGLTENLIEDIRKIGKYFEVDLYLFGSRARGDYKYNSDIDIVIWDKLTTEKEFQIKDAFDKINSAYKIDLVFGNKITNENFFKVIKEEGVKL